MSARRALVLLALAPLLPVAAASAATHHPKPPGRFSGTNAQGIAVALSAPNRHGTRNFTYQAKMTCSDGSTYEDYSFTDAVTLNVHGNFRDARSTNAGAIQTVVRGAVSGRRATGEMRIVEFFSDTPVTESNGTQVTPLEASGPVRCDSGNVSWSATARK
ncbi:MAG TPA: hypothetical protein VHX88_01380 [Solirubrobacteraceae bacterium]|jgi:hypothetical protein|nr:hypothetical protein [Solirubrobacteraceae bacterium]